MANDNNVVPNVPIPLNDSNSDINKEIILKENFNQELFQHLNSKDVEFILPDKLKVHEKKNVKELKKNKFYKE